MPGKILVVDDVATNRIILKAKLGIACYDVMQAGDGPEALAMARTEAPDLILLDLAMPGMSGMEVLDALKAGPETARFPVVIVTSRMDTRARLAALRAGAEDFLTKPVDDMILAARVRALLRSRLLSEELELRDGTRAALGLSEDPAPYTPKGHAPGAPTHAELGAQKGAHIAPGRLAIVSLGAQDAAWTGAVAAQLPHRIAHLSRAETMRIARGSARSAGPHREAPEVFMIVLDEKTRHEGLMLLSDLRASPGTCHAAILVALPREAQTQLAIALDLGASDVMTLPVDPEEAALRLSLQLARSRDAHALRRRVRDGLRLALTDPLTGLPNRRHGLSHLDRVCADALRHGTTFAVMMLDLDRFKSVNDRYGHAAGDAVLRSVASRLQAQLRGTDLLARIGGEEFLVVLTDTNPGDAMQTAAHLCRAVDAFPVPVPEQPPSGRAAAGAIRSGASLPVVELRQTVSIGMAFGPAGPSSAPTDAAGPEDMAPAARRLLGHADAALLRAKAAGRNRVVEWCRGGAGEAAA